MEVWKRKEKQLEITIEKICKCAWKIRWIWCLIKGLGCIKKFNSPIESQAKWKQINHW